MYSNNIIVPYYLIPMFLLFMSLLGGCAEHHKDSTSGVGDSVSVSIEKEINGIENNLFTSANEIEVEGKFIYFIDKANSQIFKLDKEGNIVKTTGRQGSGPGEFKDKPTFLSIHNDTLLVSDRTTDRFHIFNNNLEHIKTVSLEGFFAGIKFGPDGGVITIEASLSNDIGFYDRSGTLSHKCNPPYREKYEVDAFKFILPKVHERQIILLYPFSNRISVIDKECNLLKSFTVKELPKRAELDNLGTASMNKMMPTGTVIHDVLTYKGYTYILGGDFSNNPAREIYIMNSKNKYLHSVTLPQKASSIHFGEEGTLWASGEDTGKFFKYKIHHNED